MDARTKTTGRSTHLDRTQILDATEASLNELGYDGTTIRQIAKRLNCAVGSIYRYFQDKRDLLDAVTQRRFEPVLDLLNEGGSVEASVALYTSIASAYPQQYRLMFWLTIAGETKPGTAGVVIPKVVYQILDIWMERFQSAESAQQLWALVHGKLMLGEAWAASDADPTGAKPIILVDASGKTKPVNHPIDDAPMS